MHAETFAFGRSGAAPRLSHQNDSEIVLEYRRARDLFSAWFYDGPIDDLPKHLQAPPASQLALARSIGSGGPARREGSCRRPEDAGADGGGPPGGGRREDGVDCRGLSHKGPTPARAMGGGRAPGAPACSAPGAALPLRIRRCRRLMMISAGPFYSCNLTLSVEVRDILLFFEACSGYQLP